MSLPAVGTVVLHYRRLEDTRRCLRSLGRLDYPGHRVLLVDNASGDGSAEALEREFPGVPQLRLPRNVGYAGGNNRGIERLLEEGVDFVQLLNADVELVESDYLSGLVDAFRRHPDWGAAGPLVFLRDRDTLQRTWLRYPTLRRLASLSLLTGPVTLPAREAPRTEREVEAVNGVCLLLRSRALREVGGFDEDLFMYGEETELCYRLARAGWRAGLVPVPSIVHHQRDPGGGFHLAHDLCRANQVRFLRRHRGPGVAGAAALWLAATGVAKAAAGQGPGLGAYLRELLNALRGRPAGPREKTA